METLLRLLDSRMDDERGDKASDAIVVVMLWCYVWCTTKIECTTGIIITLQHRALCVQLYPLTMHHRPYCYSKHIIKYILMCVCMLCCVVLVLLCRAVSNVYCHKVWKCC